MMVLDASAIVKLVVDEPHSGTARKKVDAGAQNDEPLYAPDIALAEAMNVIWKYSALKGQKSIDPYNTMADLLLIWDRLTIVDTEGLALIAMKIALENGITIYDALYAALSKLNRAPLLTFDKRLNDTASKIGIELVIQ